MLRLIPTSVTESWYEQTVTLDGTDYLLRFEWCERERRWYMDLETLDGTVLATAIKVCADRPLTQRLTNDVRPAGMLWCIDRTGQGADPDLRDLGRRCLIMYVDGADVA